MDPTNPDFDPLKALYDPNFVLPNVSKHPEETPSVYDNVEKCVAVITGKAKERRDVAEMKSSARASKAGPSTFKVSHEDNVPLQRNFRPEQMPIAVQRQDFRDVLTRMQEYKNGPMGRLAQVQRDKIRVKVWTRNEIGVRGVARGFIVAFDKHWNLCLSDVDEEFTRKRVRKSFPVAGKEGAGKSSRRKLLPSDLPVNIKMGSSLMRVVAIRGKHEVCVRHVQQVMLRGEHVVMVGVDEYRKRPEKMAVTNTEEASSDTCAKSTSETVTKPGSIAGSVLTSATGSEPASATSSKPPAVTGSGTTSTTGSRPAAATGANATSTADAGISNSVPTVQLGMCDWDSIMKAVSKIAQPKGTRSQDGSDKDKAS